MKVVRRAARRLGILTALACGGSLTGCGAPDGLNRQAIAGTVTFGGAPLDRGTIVFVPSNAPPTSTVASADVIDGRFQIGAAEGPIPGVYLVSISSLRDVAPGPRALGSGPGSESEAGVVLVSETIPARFNTQTTLEVEVQAGGGSFRFDIPNPPEPK